MTPSGELNPPAGGKAIRRGTHRAVPPETTWSRIACCLGVVGITRVADVTWLDDLGIPTAVAVRPNAATLSVSQGKGLTTLLAKVSAAMEAVELWHAEQPMPLAARAPAAALGRLGYQLGDLQCATPSLAADHVVLDWVLGTGMDTGTRSWVPADYVGLDSRVEQRWEPRLFRSTSNGLASGNTISEAAAHGLYEVIERDSIARLHQLRLTQRPVLDPETVTHPDCRWVLDRYREADNVIEAFDATSDLGVPCYEVNIWSRAMPLLFNGTGAHLDPAVALSRALTEAAQTRLTAINGSRDDLTPHIYTLGHGQREGEPTAPPPPPGPRVSFDRWPDHSTDRFDDDLALITERLSNRRGIDPILVDLTRPELGLAVAKIVAPGLAHALSHDDARSRREQP